MPVKTRLDWKRFFQVAVYLVIDVVAAGITARVLGQGFLFACLIFLGVQLVDRDRRKAFAAPHTSTPGPPNLRVLIPRDEQPPRARPLEGRIRRADASHAHGRAHSALRLVVAAS